MAEMLPLDGQLNGGGSGGSAGGGGDGQMNSGPPPKRQRRPSVRLGEIGGDPLPQELRRPKPTKEFAPKGSKTRPLTNLAHQESGKDGGEFGGGYNHESGGAIGSWRVPKRGPTTKRVRSNWVSKVDEGDGDENFDNSENLGSGGDEGQFRDFDREMSESPLNSVDDDGRGRDRREEVRGRISDGPSDNWNNSERNGVRVWLNQLGLGRYAPVFEIHEVDDEVLPLLTLEDLKDMGISAVGSRRKMYCSIQKLNKGFS